MKRYYEVWVASASYHSQELLTYHSASAVALEAGAIVGVPLKHKQVLGIVRREVSAPNFTTKELVPRSWPALPAQLLRLIEWMHEYYPAPSGTILQQFLPQSLQTASEQLPTLNVTPPHTTELPQLSAEQRQVIAGMQQSGTYLLHGNTGSGKTRVYQELASQTIQTGRSVIVLTPEISLTSQLSGGFRNVFGERVIVLHSHLTLKERRTAWLTIVSATEPLVVIGARSALFAPLRNVGLIVVDEAHEAAYKQEQAPYYHAVRVAGKLAALYNARLVLGSATPSIVDYYIAEQKNIPILRMQQLATSTQRPNLELSIVDLKDRSLFTRQLHISNQLLEAIGAALAKQEQVLIFINRRGTARIVLCSNCSWQALCPNCDVPLTYHGDEHMLRCHICNHREAAIASCPVCHSTDILFKSVGTKALLDELQNIFPKARLQRFDSDNKKLERFEQHYESVLRGDVDILVGTQTIAKGLDLPRLSVVGVINADTSLAIPDYTAQEKTYQLISQVIGRIGRGHRHGHAIIQTYMPNSLVLGAALRQDWQTFYAQELKEREQFVFPPFCHLLKLTCRRASPVAAKRAAEQLAAFIETQRFKVVLNGPAPSFHEKHGQRFEWQLILKARQRHELTKIVAQLPSGWSYDIDPISLL